MQKLIETGDGLADGGTVSGNHDFTAYVPLNGASDNGFLTVNQENTPGGVMAMNLQLNGDKLWNISMSKDIDFSSVGGTARNCSGTVTAWSTVISCEETTSTDGNDDGYNDLGWCVEIDPASKTVLHKLWALGNFKHENVAIHSNARTVYQGADSNPGYLFKFVADEEEDLTQGSLYVYQGSKAGAGNWLLLNNATAAEQNSILSQCSNLSATIFHGVEDVEVGPDGMVYLAVKGEGRVYRFQDSDPITGTSVPLMETFVGGMDYEIVHSMGSTTIPWGNGNDNLAFDGEGNLWVFQDGGENYIWVVKNGHLQTSPRVELFGIAPSGSEPTGITFSPDYQFLFMSIQHPSSSNSSSTQVDAAGDNLAFDEDISIVIAKSENLGILCLEVGQTCDDGDNATYDDVFDEDCNCAGTLVIEQQTYSITSSSDDAEEDVSNNSVSLASSDLEMSLDLSTNRTQVVGLRFNNVSIPAGKLIEEAYIQFTTDESNTSTSNLSIYGEKSSSPSTFTTTGPTIVSARPRTNAKVDWLAIPSWTTPNAAGINQRSPSIVEIINEIRSETSYSVGSSMVFLIEGTGTRNAISFDKNPSLSPQLVLKLAEPNINNVGISESNPKAKLVVNQGDILVESIGSGVILKSPDGNCWKLTVDNNGTVTSISVQCPN